MFAWLVTAILWTNAYILTHELLRQNSQGKRWAKSQTASSSPTKAGLHWPGTCRELETQPPQRQSGCLKQERRMGKKKFFSIKSLSSLLRGTLGTLKRSPTALQTSRRVMQALRTEHQSGHTRTWDPSNAGFVSNSGQKPWEEHKKQKHKVILPHYTLSASSFFASPRRTMPGTLSL